jgi:hypothetical protein
VGGRAGRALGCQPVSPSWLWIQGAIVVFVVAGMVIAIVKLS